MAWRRTKNFAVLPASWASDSPRRPARREFVEAVEEFRNKHVLLIDTPGYGQATRWTRGSGRLFCAD